MRAPLFRALNPAAPRSTRATALAHQAGPSSTWANGCSPRRGDKRRPGVSGSDMRRAMASNTRRRPWDHGGRSTTERGYGAAWQRLRRQVLASCPLCVRCTEAGRVTPASQVHHIVPKADGGTDAIENLQPICDECHEAAHGRGGPVQVGVDGWPVGR